MTWCTSQKNTNKFLAADRLAPHHACSIVLQIDGQCRLHSATSWYHRFGLQHSLDHTQGVMQRALHLITHEIICPAQDERRTRTCLCAEIHRGKREVNKAKFFAMQNTSTRFLAMECAEYVTVSSSNVLCLWSNTIYITKLRSNTHK